MGNNCNCIGKNGEDGICKTESSQAITKIQANPRSQSRKTSQEQFNKSHFIIEPIGATPRRCESVKNSRPNSYNTDFLLSATENYTYQTEQKQKIQNSIFKSNQSSGCRQTEHTPSSCSPNSNSKRVSKIFNNLQQQKQNSQRRQKSHDIFNTYAIQDNQNMNIEVKASPQNIENAEWSLSPDISQRSRFFTAHTAATNQKTYNEQCDISDVINFNQENNSENTDKKSSTSTNIFEQEFQRNSDLEMIYKDIQRRQQKQNNYDVKITELTQEDEENDIDLQTKRYIEQHNFFTNTVQEQTSLTYSDSSICNISSLTPEQMNIIKSRYNQFESSNSDKSTQIENQSYSYTQQKILLSRELSHQKLSSIRASDSILGETIKRNSDYKEYNNLILA